MGKIKVNEIEKHDATEVTVNSNVVMAAGTSVSSPSISTDTISEKTSASGVTIDGVLLKDSSVNTDTITEKTSGSGVTIDGALVKDSKIAATAGGGLVLLSSNTVSGSSSTSVDNIFTSAYTNYKVIMNIRGSHTGTQYITVKLRTGGSDNSSSLYTSGVRTFRINSDIEFEQRIDSGTDWKLNGWAGNEASNTISNEFTIFGPAEARRTQLNGNFTVDEVSQQQGGYLIGTYEADTTFDGISIIALGGTWSGQINIYGLGQ